MRMNQKTVLTSLIAAMAGVLSIPAGAHSATYTFAPTAVCMRDPAGITGGDFAEEPYGVAFDFGSLQTSNGSTPVEVICTVNPPATTGSSDTNDDAYLYYDDNDYYDNFRCGAGATNYNQSVINGLYTRYGCSTSGGCTTDPGTGTYSKGYLSFQNIDRPTNGWAYIWCEMPGDDSEIEAVYYNAA